MTKRLKIIVGLGVLLALCLGFAASFSSHESNIEETPADEVSLSIHPFVGDENWRFSEVNSNLIDENLLAPARGKFGFTDSQEAFARCGSFVDYALIETPEQPLFEDGYYYGTLMVYMGCDGPTSYSFRISLDGSRVYVKNTEGSFVSMRDWVKEE